MSQSIISRIIGAQTDQRLALLNGQASRVLAFTSSWTRIRLGMQFCISNVATISGVPVWALGATAGTANGFGDTSTTHFLGVRAPTTGNLVYTAGPPAYDAQSGGAGINLCKKVGTLITSIQSAPTFNCSAAPTTNRSVVIVEITKGSPNFTVDCACASTTAAAQLDCTDTDFLNMMELASLTTIGTVKTGYTNAGAITTAIDEATNGFFTALNVFWDRTSAPLEISALRIKKLA